MGYYSGGRKYALNGKGWTLVLGTVVSMSYVRAKAKMYDEDNSQEHHKSYDRHGKEIIFHDQPPISNRKDEDIVLKLYRQLPELPLPNMYAVCGVFTCVWAFRMAGTFNRLMTVRFSDIGYQLRRPDVLAAKVTALKYLGLPLLVVPVTFGLCYAAMAKVEGDGAMGPIRRSAYELRATLAQPCREMGYIVRDAMAPASEELASSPLAAFAQRSHHVGKEAGCRVPNQAMGDVVAEQLHS